MQDPGSLEADLGVRMISGDRVELGQGAAGLRGLEDASARLSNVSLGERRLVRRTCRLGETESYESSQ